MKITALVENTTSNNMFKTEHGLSLYIETKMHKVLFDTGASDLFLENAIKMNIDLKKVDIMILSHGHYDHSGGVKTFMKMNKKAKIYIHEDAFKKHFSKREDEFVDIGIDFKRNTRMVITHDYYEIDNELFLFSKLGDCKLVPSNNKFLYMDRLENDDFKHEQNLIIKEEKNVLISGCAHNGIVNIVEKANEYISINHVISGFHLYSSKNNKSESKENIDLIIKELQKYKAFYHTCHCTGLKPYEYLKLHMKEKIDYLSTGKSIKI